MVQYSKPKAPPHPASESSMMIPKLLAHRIVEGDKAAVMELQALTGPESQDSPPPSSNQPMALEYTSTQLQSTWTNLEVCAKQDRAYMVDHGEWVECVHPPPPTSALPIQMTTTIAPSKGLGFLVTQSVATLLTAIMEHKGNLKGLSINKVLQVWPSHFEQFGSYITKMSDEDREMLQIADPKVGHSKIDS